MHRLSRDQVRNVDRVAIEKWNVPGVLLMENAGRGVADVMCQIGIDGPVLIVCAKGNNGGDGFVIARHLHLRGHQVEVLLVCERDEISGDARINFELLTRSSIGVHRYSQISRAELSEKFSSADWLVDAMLGTGATGEPRDPLPQLISEMNQATAKRLAIDVPTGLDAQTGRASATTFIADHTCTFVAEKAGFAHSTANQYLGQMHVLDIGLPWELVERAKDD